MMAYFKTMRVFAFAMAASTFATSAFSGTLLYATQSTLQNHGYYDDKPDGIMGPKTRAALRAYASDRSIEGDLPSVYSDMITRNYKQREDISNESLVKEIKEKVSQLLKDPESANFRNIYRISGISFGGHEVDYICGEVNGKNSYGAYAGYSFFYGYYSDIGSNHTILVPEIIESETMASMVCELTFK